MTSPFLHIYAERSFSRRRKLPSLGASKMLIGVAP